MARINRMYIPHPKGSLKKGLKSLMGHCKKYMPVIVLSMILACMGAILSLYGPNKLKDLTNLITEGMAGSVNIKAVLNVCYLLVGIYACSFIFSYIQGFIMSTVTQKVSKGLRQNISKKINKLPLKYIDGNKAGDILSRVTNDVDTIAQSLNSSIVSLISSICLLLGSIIMMFVTNWILAITAILSTIFGFVVMMLIMKVMNLNINGLLTYT